ncbi:oligosaccharide repeat unit polymerase [Flavobacterium sp. LS1R47]|uniref:Oligosaccharide repeat unit polymerase n=1 Tax=Flavobacterium frigoritolerans TaxID=2987686 RepID=A0A9X2ZKT9_9FLAO|nr:O-antigen polymerase [Flavobacterium frigoritolerans]MCV9931275.1 oligosaccharide repeat unit polymerase [Flavobacterium frigoritolerans]
MTYKDCFSLIKKYSLLILLWIFLTSTAPWIFYRWPGHPYKILTFICLVFFILLLSIKKNKLAMPRQIIFLLFVQIAFYFLMLIYHSDVANFNLIVQLISFLITILYIKYFLGFELFVKSFIYIVLITGIGGVLVFFTHLLIGVTPFFVVSYGTDNSFFLGLTTTNIFIDVGSIRMMRFAGFFDEPGTFGLYALYAIILNKVYFKNVKIEFLLILITIFTFSVAFYFAITVYVFFFYFNKKNIGGFFAFFSILILFYVILINFDSPIVDKINEMSFSRLEETSTDFSNSNRGELVVNDFKLFSESPILGVGYSNPKISGSNFFSIFARFGIIGSIFYYLLFIYLFWAIIKIKSFYYFKFFVVLLISLMHRPEFSSLLSLLIFYCLIYFLENLKTSKHSYSPIT